MLVCDCGFWRNHQEGVTEKELAAMTERAKVLTVTPVSDNGDVRIFLVKGGDSPHYVTLYPDGDKKVDNGGSANVLADCKHLVAVRNFLGESNDKERERTVRKVVFSEEGEEADTEDVSVGVSAVG